MRKALPKGIEERDRFLRKTLTAQIHIALKELCIPDEDYRTLLRNVFGVESSRDLSIKGLIGLKGRFMSLGWMPKRGGTAQIEALQERVGQVVLHSDLTPARVRGLTRKICRVEDARWCRDAETLKRLLAALNKIIKRESEA